MGYIGKVPADVLIDPMVDSAAITDATIVTADLANDAVTAAKLAADSVDSSELVNGSVDNAHLAGSIAMNKTNLTAGTGLTLSTDTLSVDAAQTQITSVGTIGTGVWNGTAIASAYLDADTAHLSGTQTFSGAKTFSSKILVDNDAAEHLTLKRDGSHWWDIQVSGNGNLNIQKNSATDNFLLDASGNVGVGAIINDFTPTLGVTGAQPGLVLDDSATEAFLVAYCDGDASVMMYDHSDDFIIKQAESVGGSSAADVLKLDSSKNATFSGDVTITNSIPLLYMNDTSGAKNNQIFFQAGGTSYFRIGTDITTNNGTEILQITDGGGSNARLSIDSAGKVGIGTNAPKNYLHVSDGSTSNLSLSDGIIITDASNPKLVFEDTGEGTDDKVIMFNYYDEALRIMSSNDDQSSWNKASIAVFNRDGNVSIGGTTTDYPLSIWNDIGSYSLFIDNDNGASQGLFIKCKSNDANHTSRSLIKAQSYGSGGSFTDKFILDIEGNATFAGSVKYPNGNAAAPGLAFANDANTGVYSGGTDVFAISTAGTYRAEWDGNGKFYTGGHSSIGSSASAGRWVVFGGHYGIWNAYHYFTHNLTDRAVDLEFSVNNMWTSGEIILQGTYSYQNVSGWNKFAFTYNQNTSSDYGRGVSSFTTDSDIHQNNDDVFSVATSGNGSDSGGWDSTASKHKISIRRGSNQGNGCWITLILYRDAAAFFPNLSLGSEYSY